jgi:hypothetical protein
MMFERTAVADVGEERSAGSTLWIWWLVALFPVVFQLVSTLHHLKFSWDDAAITAAFSRTWAQSGRFALTPVSQTVEGYSSALWFLLLSVPYFFTHHPDAGLIWMKILSAVFAALCLPLIYRIALRQFANQTAAMVSVLLFAFCFTTHQEIDNGMEMNMAAFLLLLLFHLLTRPETRHRVIYASIVVCLLLLTRFEMPFMLGLLFCGFLYAGWRRRPDTVPPRDLWIIFAVAALFFGATAVWRHHVFGEWMPNTIYAKRFLPYKDWSTPTKFLQTRLLALNEPIRVLRFPMAIAVAVCAWGLYSERLSWASLSRVHPAFWLLALGCFLFGAMFGQNWGHAGRMIAAMIPFLILTVVGMCVVAVPDRRSLTWVFGVVLVAHSLVWLRHAIHPFHIVSMEDIEPVGFGADAIRAALHQDRLVVMMSDVGSSSLCCAQLAVVDSGLLSDPTLARTGWDGFASYFGQARPELVETHYFWAQDEHIYNGDLLDGYSIVASNGVRFFLRDDLYAKLLAEAAGSVMPVEKVPACMAWYPEDQAFSRSKQTCLVLNDPDAQRNLQ